jgi:small subunit ribosomal protein S20
MPIIKSAIKRVRSAIAKTKKNTLIKNRFKELVKEFKGFIDKGEKKAAAAIFSNVQKAIDMAAKNNIIHKNNAGRRKSSLSKMIKGEKTSKVVTEKASPAKKSTAKTATKAKKTVKKSTK